MPAEAAELRGYRALGLAGAVALAVGGIGVGALPSRDPFAGWPGVAELRAAPLVAVASAYLGMTLLVAAWLRLGRLVRCTAVPERELLRTLAWWAAPLAVVPPMYSRDVYAYIAQGALVLRGFDPYTTGPAVLGGYLAEDVPAMWRDTPSPYGPVFLLLAAAVVKLAGAHTVWSAYGMRLLALAGVALIARYLPRLAESAGVSPSQALWLGVLNPLLLAHLVAGAHNDALMIGLAVAGLAAALRQPPLGAALVALAILVKAPAVVWLAALVPLWAGRLRGRWRLVRAAAGGTAVVAVVLTVVTLLSGLGYGWLAALDTPAGVRNGMSMTTSLGLLLGRLAAVLGLASVDGVLVTVRTLGLVAAALIAGWALVRGLARYLPGRLRAADPVWALGVALTAFTALSPVVQPWYLLWGFVPLAAGGAASARVRWFVVVASTALLFYLLPFGGGPVNPLSAGAVVGIAIGLFYLRLRPPPRQVLQREAVSVDA